MTEAEKARLQRAAELDFTIWSALAEVPEVDREAATNTLALSVVMRAVHLSTNPEHMIKAAIHGLSIAAATRGLEMRFVSEPDPSRRAH